MEPLSPNDPLHALLGKARAVEPRPNFTQNVMRAIRQVPQTQSVWERMQDWLSSLAMPRVAHAGLAAALLLVATLLAAALWNPGSTPGASSLALQSANPVTAPAGTQEPLPAAAEDPMDRAMASELDSVDTLSVLLAQQDTSALTDSEIALLLY